MVLPEPTAVQYLSAGFSVWPCWLYHTALGPCISRLLQHTGQRGSSTSLCLLCLGAKEVQMLGAEGGGREGCLSSLCEDSALLKYHSMRGEAFVLGGELR